MKKSLIIHPLWVFGLVIGYLLSTILFGYYFLFFEQLNLNEESIIFNEQESLDHKNSWVIRTLSLPRDNQPQTNQPNRMFSQQYSIYLYLEDYCTRTINQSTPKFDKFILFVIDAFRMDFVHSLSGNFNYYSDPMLPYMEKIMKTNGKYF